jgi:hypothetical protein
MWYNIPERNLVPHHYETLNLTRLNKFHVFAKGVSQVRAQRNNDSTFSGNQNICLATRLKKKGQHIL